MRETSRSKRLLGSTGTAIALAVLAAAASLPAGAGCPDPPTGPLAVIPALYEGCIGETSVILDASGSYDWDNRYCDPGAGIIEYQWDLDDDAAFADALGPVVDATAYFASRGPGTYDIGLLVVDDEFFSAVAYTVLHLYGPGGACPLECTDIDGDGYGSGPTPGDNLVCPGGPEWDCRPDDPNSSPGKPERCWGGIDNDCDGLRDFFDVHDCITTPVCGNHLVDSGEQCDDGEHFFSGIGCDPSCRFENDPACGNGLPDPGESCDDGNERPDDGCSPFCLPEFCGDGVVNGPEYCDDGNAVDTDACRNDCTPRWLDVFVARGGELHGDMGGVRGADALCTAVARQSGRRGTYAAWLSGDSSSPSTRFARSPVPYRTADGSAVADRWVDLTDGLLLSPIGYDIPQGGPPEIYSVWTNTDPDGTIHDPLWDCDGWTSDDYFEVGGLGDALETGPAWTATGGAADCRPQASAIGNLYCFQQHCAAVESNDCADQSCPWTPGHGLIDETSGDSGFHQPTDKDLYSWRPQPGATLYEVARSTSPDFTDACVTQLTASTSWSAPDDPAPGAVYYYLNRPVQPCLGSWGAGSDGQERGQVCGHESACGNGADDDGDLATDCDDPDCDDVLACQVIATFEVVDTLADDVPLTGFADFLQPLDLGPTDYIYFELQRDSSNKPAWCSENAQFYRNAYLLFAPTEGSAISGGWPKWRRAVGTGAWVSDTAPRANTYGNECFGPYTWCSEQFPFPAGPQIALFPHGTESCELYDGINGDCNYAETIVWSATIRIAKTRRAACGF